MKNDVSYFHPLSQMRYTWLIVVTIIVMDSTDGNMTPYHITQPSTNGYVQIVPANAVTLTLVCSLNVTFPPGMVITWLHNGDVFTTITTQVGEIGKSITLQKSPKPSDAGIWECVFNDTEGYTLRRDIILKFQNSIIISSTGTISITEAPSTGINMTPITSQSVTESITNHGASPVTDTLITTITKIVTTSVKLDVATVIATEAIAKTTGLSNSPTLSASSDKNKIFSLTVIVAVAVVLVVVLLIIIIVVVIGIIVVCKVKKRSKQCHTKNVEERSEQCTKSENIYYNNTEKRISTASKSEPVYSEINDRLHNNKPHYANIPISIHSTATAKQADKVAMQDNPAYSVSTNLCDHTYY